MKIKGSIIKIDQINALAEFSFIHCMYINYLCVLLVLRQKTDPGLKQTPLGLHRPASLTDINILVLKKLLNTCHSHFAADTTWVCTQSRFISVSAPWQRWVQGALPDWARVLWMTGDHWLQGGVWGINYLANHISPLPTQFFQSTRLSI